MQLKTAEVELKCEMCDGPIVVGTIYKVRRRTTPEHWIGLSRFPTRVTYTNVHRTWNECFKFIRAQRETTK